MPEEIRIPKQKRSIEKKEALKKAAIELFSTKGFHNTSSNEIAKKADVSIGTFYSYFTDKKSLYEELIADLYNDTLKEISITDLSQTNSPRELIRGYVAFVMRNHEYMTAFQKEISALSLQYDDFHELEEKSRSGVFSMLFSLLESNKHLLKISDLKTASLIIQCTLEAVIHEVTFYENDYDKERVIDELTECICRYCIADQFLSPAVE